MTTVGIVGTGRMGGAFARRLAATGATVVLQNRTRERAAAVAASIGEAARVVDTPADAAAAADVTITMLADDDAVKTAFIGPDGVVNGARPGTVLVDMSTVLPATIRSLEGAVRATGAGLLDAPVSGSVTLAESGQLTVMVGGSATDLDRARPALEPLAKGIVHLGSLGSGAVMKLAINTVIYGLNGALAEGLALAEAAGVDRAVAYDVIAAGAPGAPFVGYKRAAFLDPEGSPVAFALELAEKDLRLIGELAGETGTAMPQAAVNLEAIRAAERTVGADADFARLASHLRQESRS